jgi:hypothetical protein
MVGGGSRSGEKQWMMMAHMRTLKVGREWPHRVGHKDDDDLFGCLIRWLRHCDIFAETSRSPAIEIVISDGKIIVV